MIENKHVKHASFKNLISVFNIGIKREKKFVVSSVLCPGIIRVLWIILPCGVGVS